jgi:hypothetical protein
VSFSNDGTKFRRTLFNKKFGLKIDKGHKYIIMYKELSTIIYLSTIRRTHVGFALNEFRGKSAENRFFVQVGGAIVLQFVWYRA